MSESAATSNDKIVRFFSKHIVPLLVTGQKGNQRNHDLYTAFVLSVYERWFLITAGHCLKHIEDLVASGGYDTITYELIDSLGEGAKDSYPVPFGYDPAKSFYLNEDYPFDYGVIELSRYYQEQLKANGVVALNEETWKKELPTPYAYLLLGIPSELVKFDNENDLVEIGAPILIPVTQLDKMPTNFPIVDVPLFYGHIELKGEIESIQGMSGGPILALHKNAKGETRYTLAAVQSRWLRNSHDIAACPTRLLGEYLEIVVKAREQ